MKQITIFLVLVFASIASGRAQQITRLTLDDAIAFAKENAAELKNAELEIKTSQEVVKNVISTGLPQITASGNFTHNPQIAALQFPDFISPAVYSVLISEGLLTQDRFQAGSSQTVQFGASSSMTGMVNLSQLIFDGTYFLGLKAAKEYIHMAELLKDMSEVTLIESVKKAYFGALIGEQNLLLMRQSLVQLNKTLEDSKILKTEGYAEQIDIDRLQLSLTKLDAQVQNMEMQNNILHQLLKVTMGMKLNQAIVLDGNLTDYLTQLSPQENFSIKDRVEYKILSQQLILDSLNIKRYRVGYMPSLHLNASYQQNSFASAPEFKDLGKTWNPGTTYGFNLSIPIFDGFYKQTKISQAKIKYQQDQNTLDQTTNNLLFQVEQARLNVKMQDNSLAAQAKAKELANGIYSTVRIKYNEGLASSFELILAENDMITSEIDYSNALYQRLLAQIELDKSLGNINPNK